MGYRNLDRGANHIAGFEESGAAHDGFVGRVMHALLLDGEEGERPARSDESDRAKAFAEWVSKPRLPTLHARLPMGYAGNIGLPAEVCSDEERALEFAREYALKSNHLLQLLWCRRYAYLIRPDGTWVRAYAQPHKIKAE